MCDFKAADMVLFWAVKPLLLLLSDEAVAVTVADAGAVADTFRMGGDHESYKAL